MSTTFYCPLCGKQMAVASEHLGLTVACPHCQGEVQTPHGTLNAPPPPPGVAVHDPRTGELYSTRNKVAAGILGLLFGGLGVHRFYLGYVGIGIVQIIVTGITCGIGSIWGFVEGILCLTGSMRDIDGRPLRD
jgi:TM2 domain-containing membrane protein YozV